MFRDITINTVQQLRDLLRRKHAVEHARMDIVDAWRTLDEERLKPRIWRETPSDSQGKYTIVKPTLAAVNDTAIAQHISSEPTIRVQLKDTLSTQSSDQANMTERLMHAMRHEFERYRAVSVDEEVIDAAFTYGSIIIKCVWLDQEERGEQRESVGLDSILGFDQDNLIEEDDGSFSDISDEGEFMIYPEILDPRDVFYQLNAAKTKPMYVIHNYLADWLDVMAAFPGVEDDPKFKQAKQTEAAYTAVEVLDYWDDKHHAIFINNIQFGSTEEHEYGKPPFIIKRIREQQLRDSVQKDGTGARGYTSHTMQTAVTPFCWQMVGSMDFYSFGESLLASYLPEMANSPIIHQGVSSMGQSPYFQRARNPATGALSARKVYMFQGNKTAEGRAVWPAFDGEKFYPLIPTPIADHLSAFVAGRSADVEITSFAQGMLSGQLRSDPSGYSVVQQRQLTASKYLPYRKAADSALSDLYMMAAEWMVKFWDRGKVGIKVQDLIAGETLELTPDILGNIKEIYYQINPMRPDMSEQEIQAILQVHASGLMRDRTAMENMPYVTDPSKEEAGIAYDVFRKQHPKGLEAAASQFAKDEGLPYFDSASNQIVLDGQAAPEQPQPEIPPEMMQQMQAQMAGAQGPPPEGAPPVANGNGAGPIPPEGVPQ